MIALVLSTSVIGATVGLSANASNSSAITSGEPKLIPTPEQTAGPFYPGYETFKNADSDMANYSAPKDKIAKGELILILGMVLDLNGNHVPNAEIQFWQTDGDQGRYLNEKTDKPLDPNFDYVGRVIPKDSNSDSSSFGVITVRPKEYEADEDWTRPSHIHVRVLIKGKLILTTQVYFSDEMDLINKDKIIARLTPEQRKAVIIDLEQGFGLMQGVFNIVLPIKSELLEEWMPDHKGSRIQEIKNSFSDIANGINLYQPELLEASGMSGENLTWIESVDSLGNKLNIDVALQNINRTALNHYRYLPVQYFVLTNEVVRRKFSGGFRGFECNKIEIKKMYLTIEGDDGSRHEFKAISEKILRSWWEDDERCE
jgi:protocatechuate 3,4-dioxygenase beta subunit